MLHGSYYRLGVGRRTGQTTTAPGAASRPTRCRSARSRRHASQPTQPVTATTRPSTAPNDQANAQPKPQKSRPRRPPDRLRTVHETSAGGLVIDGIDGPKDGQVAALIGRIDRRGRMLWSLPKGHIELGETAEQTAIREVAEETGIQGSVLAALGSIDYWFVTEGRRVHKTVHHYLMRFLGGELSDEDVEVSEVAWVPLKELPSRLAYADERRLAEVAGELIDKLHADGPAALPPLPRTSPRRRAQTHSHTRNRRPDETDNSADERVRPRTVTTAARPCCRALVAIGLLALFVVPMALPRAAAGEPGSTPFLPGAHRPRHPRGRHHHQRAGRHRHRHGAQRRRPSGPRRDGAPRGRRGGRRRRPGCAPTSPAMSTSSSPSPTSSPLAPELARGQSCSVHAVLSAAVRGASRRWASRSPASTR